MLNRPTLSAIVALARAGASGQAMREFEAGGFGEAADAAALTVKGRLLKDLAACSSGEERRRLCREAAAAYARAAAAAPSSYPLINAATLYYLAGDPAEAASQAREVLDLVEGHPDEPETPYYRAATIAEALLLLDRHDDARAAFAEAVSLAPRAWEDHASTLRQFGLILGAQARDAAWLDAHRPPRSLHFGGHMSFDANVAAREHLDEKIAAMLEEEGVGFGYGALAAGADIIIAEALLARGAELHAVLPGGAGAFAAVSVDPLGEAWRTRFEAVLARAETVRAVRPVGTIPDRAMIALGDEVAMGAAVMNARRLESRALQLLVLDEDAAPAPGEPAHAHRRWADAGWRQRILTAPREAAPDVPPLSLPAAPHSRFALLSIALRGDEAGAQLARLAEPLRALPRPEIGPYFTGSHVLFAYGEAVEAARAAAAFAGGSAGGQRPGIGGHYGIADPLEDPFGGGVRIGGDAAALAAAAAASAPPGSVFVTEDFAAALAASAVADIFAEFVGELDSAGGTAPVGLYALKPRL